MLVLPTFDITDSLGYPLSWVAITRQVPLRELPSVYLKGMRMLSLNPPLFFTSSFHVASIFLCSSPLLFSSWITYKAYASRAIAVCGTRAGG